MYIRHSDDVLRVVFTALKVSVFGYFLVHISGIWTECEQIWSISPYSVRKRGNTDQKNSKYGHFLRSVYVRTFDCDQGAVYFFLVKLQDFRATALPKENQWATACVETRNIQNPLKHLRKSFLQNQVTANSRLLL